MLAHRIPYPPHTGDKVRAYQVARHLADRHELTLGFVIDDAGRPRGPRGARAARFRTSSGAGSGSRPRSRAGLAALGMRPLAQHRVLPLAVSLRQAVAAAAGRTPTTRSTSRPRPWSQYVRGPRLPVVMDFVDVDSDKWTQYATKQRPPLSWAYRLEGRRLRRFEAEARSLGPSAASSPPPPRRRCSESVRAVGAHGGDSQRRGSRRLRARRRDAPTVIFTGAMDYLPNVDAVEHFCADIFPAVTRAVPGARFLIVGLNPSPAVRRLAALPGRHRHRRGAGRAPVLPAGRGVRGAAAHRAGHPEQGAPVHGARRAGGGDERGGPRASRRAPERALPGRGRSGPLRRGA